MSLASCPPSSSGLGVRSQASSEPQYKKNPAGVRQDSCLSVRKRASPSRILLPAVASSRAWRKTPVSSRYFRTHFNPGCGPCQGWWRARGSLLYGLCDKYHTITPSSSHDFAIYPSPTSVSTISSGFGSTIKGAGPVFRFVILSHTLYLQTDPSSSARSANRTQALTRPIPVHHVLGQLDIKVERMSSIES